MMPRVYFVIGMLAVSLFGYEQYRGAGLFDDPATSHSRGRAGRSVYHK
jgi:hypothetical protein